MVWRSVIISRAAKLRRDQFGLRVEQEQCARIPFEDIAVILLNHRQITLTHPVLSACAEYGIGLFSTGDNHQPNGVFLPFVQHSRSTRMQRLQLGLGKPVAKRAWARMVVAKISNQARCLQMNSRTGVDRLESLARQVRSGDSGNMEAQASRLYFPALMGMPRFTRADLCWANSALDYGYAILRGACARALVAHGLLPNWGLFHSSEQNAFNLADDLIEAFRPLVDLYVAERAPAVAPDTELRPDDKVALVGLLNVDMGMPRGVMTTLAAIDQSAASLARLFESADDTVLELPDLIGLNVRPIPS